MPINEFNTLPSRLRHLASVLEHQQMSGYTAVREAATRLDNTDLIQFVERQRDWSTKAFGPGERHKGVSDHIRSELDEIAEAPHDLKEWCDVITLALDGAWRAGFSPEEIANQLNATLERNMVRKWPDWRTVDTDKAIEHIRE